MGAGASNNKSAKKSSDTRNQMREVIKNLKSVAEPLTFIVDQGGGSFRAYIFSGLKQIIRIKSVNKWEILMDKDKLAAYRENIGGDLVNADDGTFNDYSTASPDHYHYIVDCLGTSYERAFQELCKTINVAPGSISIKLIRQTGKIRTVLHSQKDNGDTKSFDRWNSEFYKRLAEYDYELLSNQDEAMLESSAFYELNDNVNVSFIGVGMGSSSTQTYGSDGKQHYCQFDSFCGVKPARDQAAKTVATWVKDFTALLKPMFRTDKQDTVVLLNAIGYIYVKMHEPEYEGKEELLSKLKAAQKISPQDLLKGTASYAAAVEGDSEHAWSSNLLLGLAKTLASIPRCKWAICERKGPIGKSLPFETSWVKYLIFKSAREKQQREAAAKAPTGKFTDKEREQYRQEILHLQAYIIGNVTQVLTLKQVQVLAGAKWEEKILTDRKTPKQCFMELKNEDGVITRDQWEEYYSSIASLRNTDAEASGTS